MENENSSAPSKEKIPEEPLKEKVCFVMAFIAFHDAQVLFVFAIGGSFLQALTFWLFMAYIKGRYQGTDLGTSSFSTRITVAWLTLIGCFPCIHDARFNPTPSKLGLMMLRRSVSFGHIVLLRGSHS